MPQGARRKSFVRRELVKRQFLLGLIVSVAGVRLSRLLGTSVRLGAVAQTIRRPCSPTIPK